MTLGSRSAVAPPWAAAVAERLRELGPRKSDWTPWRPRRDVLAGFMVALVALPLALGFGVSSGMGAVAGITTAIVAGVLAATFGGSQVQVSGPTGAMTVVLVPIITAHGPQAVLVVGLLAGVLLVGLGYFGAGKFIRYVPLPVVEGFTVGIALIIFLQQVPAALGLKADGEKVLAVALHTLAEWAHHPDAAAPATAAVVAALVLVLARVRPGVPWALVVVIAAAIGNALLALDLDTIGVVPAGLPGPAVPSLRLGDLDELILPAVAVAALAALESLLSASVADAMGVGSRHDPDRELVGQGIANLVVPLFGGIPATAAIARTAVNVRAGAVTRLASATHAAVLLGIVLVASRWVGKIPVAALAGVLIATAVQMVRLSSLTPILRATRGDAVVLLVTATATVLADLVVAVLVGLVVAGFFALQQASRSARLNVTPLDEGDHQDEERALLDEHIVAYRLEGPLFFAAAHDFLLELAEVGAVRVCILRMSRVTVIDSTGAAVLGDTIARLEGRGVSVMLSGVRPEHERVLSGLGVFDRLAHERHLFVSTPDAIAHARQHVAREHHEPGAS